MPPTLTFTLSVINFWSKPLSFLPFSSDNISHLFPRSFWLPIYKHTCTNIFNLCTISTSKPDKSLTISKSHVNVVSLCYQVFKWPFKSQNHEKSVQFCCLFRALKRFPKHPNPLKRTTQNHLVLVAWDQKDIIQSNHDTKEEVRHVERLNCVWVVAREHACIIYEPLINHDYGLCCSEYDL